jgi:hypothetical protein
MEDEEAMLLAAGDRVMVCATIREPPRMAGYPHLERYDPSATLGGFWVDVGLGRFVTQVWVPFSALEAAR